MTAILASNQGLAEHEWMQIETGADTPCATLDDAVRWLREEDVYGLDVRERWEYTAGHVPGAVCIPQADIGVRFGTLGWIQAGHPVVAGSEPNAQPVSSKRPRENGRARRPLGGRADRIRSAHGPSKLPGRIP